MFRNVGLALIVFSTLPANDAWIAALAVQHRLPVLSRDEHFDAVPGLDRKTW